MGTMADRTDCMEPKGKDALKENFEHSYFACHTNKYLPVVYTPPRDGFNRSNPTVVGRRIHVTAIPKDQKADFMAVGGVESLG
ncbi:hypothetical protein GOBAR_DD09160 [Gossypium barbadense]|nr:hypothetical protein GOBAR_DD09160 [Gossypium barbadense]